MAKTPEDWGDDYQLFRPRCESFTVELERLINNILDEAGFDVQVEARTKEVTSFVDKIYRKNEKYEDPVAEITDLCGLRVVCYYVADVESVGQVIENEFAIDWPNSIRQGLDADPDRFGYRSDHYVVELAPPRSELAEWSGHLGLKAEIQVRTVMQHAWASVDHKIRYKGGDLPGALQRRLSRLSALLETADEQFSSIQEESRSLAAGYEESFAGGDFDIGLDVLSLQQFVRATDLDTEWIVRATDIGYQKLEFLTSYLQDPDAHIENFDLTRLIDALRALGARSIESVNEFFEGADEWGDLALRRIFIASSQAGFVPFAMPIDVLAFLALYGAGNLAAVDRSHFKDEIRTGIKAAIREKKGDA